MIRREGVVRDGRQRCRQVDAVEAGGGCRAGRWHCAVGGSVKMGYFAQHAMDLLDGERTVFQSLEDPSRRRQGLRALAGLPVFPATMSRKMPGAQAGEGAAGDGENALSTRRISWCWTSRPTIWIWRPRRC
jgi:hypothetical protein